MFNLTQEQIDILVKQQLEFLASSIIWTDERKDKLAHDDNILYNCDNSKERE